MRSVKQKKYVYLLLRSSSGTDSEYEDPIEISAYSPEQADYLVSMEMRHGDRILEKECVG